MGHGCQNSNPFNDFGTAPAPPGVGAGASGLPVVHAVATVGATRMAKSRMICLRLRGCVPAMGTSVDVDPSGMLVHDSQDAGKTDIHHSMGDPCRVDGEIIH